MKKIKDPTNNTRKTEKHGVQNIDDENNFRSVFMKLIFFSKMA